MDNEDNIDLTDYDVENIKILDPLDDPDVEIALIEKESLDLDDRNLKRNLVPINPYLEGGSLPVVFEVSESKGSIHNNTIYEPKLEKSEIIEFDLTKEKEGKSDEKKI